MSNKIVKLGEIAALIRGITYKPNDICTKNSDYAVACMRTKNIQSDLDKDDIVWIPKSIIKNPSKFLQPEDILVSSANSWNLVGKACWVPSLTFTASAGSFISILRGDPSEVDNRYLFFWFTSNRTQTKLRSFSNKTTNISNLDHKRTLNLEIPLPTLDEQRRIAKILNLCSSIKENIENVNSKSRTLNSALLIDRFGELNPKEYKNNNLINLEEVLKNITYGLTVRPKYFEEGLPLISASQIRNGYIDFLSAPKISSEDFDKLSHKCKPKKGDILFSKTGSIGHSAIVEDEKDFAIAQNVARLTFKKEKVNSIWMLNLLRSEYIQRLSISRSKGNAVKDLQLGEMKKFKIVLPPINKQSEYSDLITYVNELNKKLKIREEYITNLISSVQSFAFK